MQRRRPARAHQPVSRETVDKAVTAGAVVGAAWFAYYVYDSVTAGGAY